MHILAESQLRVTMRNSKRKRNVILDRLEALEARVVLSGYWQTVSGTTWAKVGSGYTVSAISAGKDNSGNQEGWAVSSTGTLLQDDNGTITDVGKPGGVAITYVQAGGGRCFTIDTNGYSDLYVDGTGWSTFTQKVTTMSNQGQDGSNGFFLGLDPGGYVVLRDNGVWSSTGSASGFKAVAAGGSGIGFAIDSSNNLQRYTISTNTWTSLSASASKLKMSPDYNTLWFMTTSNDLMYRNGGVTYDTLQTVTDFAPDNNGAYFIGNVGISYYTMSSGTVANSYTPAVSLTTALSSTGGSAVYDVTATNNLRYYPVSGYFAYENVDGIQAIATAPYSSLACNSEAFAIGNSYDAGKWIYPQRITISFMADGTTIATGVTSNLYARMSALGISSTTFQNAVIAAATQWEANSNINFSIVSDDGRAEGASGYAQGDSGVGDIRIGGMDLGTGTLGQCYPGMPVNGGIDGGDIAFGTNTNIGWNVGSSYDVQTVALHELGHALGLDHSSTTTDAMYAYYNALKQTPTSNDVVGVQDPLLRLRPEMATTAP
jgi:hypothetical protein